MSKQNLEIIRGANAAFVRGDLRAVEKFYSPSIEWRDLQHAPDTPGVVHGIEAVKGIWQAWQDTFPDIRADVSEYVDAGDTVICVVRWHASGKGSGIPVDLDSVDSFDVLEGKIVRATLGYRSKQDALEAAGS